MNNSPSNTVATLNTRDFDITLAELRGVSPVHISYLKNMNVRATMTLSIVINGELWGYVSFHNKTPHLPSRDCRNMCFSALEIVTSRLEVLQYRSRDYRVQQFKAIAVNLCETLNDKVSLFDAVRKNSTLLLEHFSAQGIGLLVGGKWLAIGDVVSEDACIALLKDIEEKEAGHVVGFDCLSEMSCLEPYDVGNVAGALVIQMFNEDAIYIFRYAVKTQVRWAGAPEKIVFKSDGIARLHPRASFSEYILEFENRCAAWSEDDIANAELMVEVNVRVGLERQMILNIQKMNVELERSNSELDNFAYVASHDLKEPLRGLAINANFLLKEEISEQANKRIVRMIDLCVRMEKLIADLLYFSRLGRGDECRETVDIYSLIDDIRHSLKETLDNSCGTITLATDLPLLQAEKSKIRTVLYNLTVNALKYNDHDTKKIEVGSLPTVSLSIGRLYNVFYIQDNGIGIKHQDTEKVFRIFSRLNGEKTYGSGTGAGLAFVKKIVESYEGQISYTSGDSGGTTFYFTLPTALDTGVPTRFPERSA